MSVRSLRTTRNFFKKKIKIKKSSAIRISDYRATYAPYPFLQVSGEYAWPICSTVQDSFGKTNNKIYN